MKMSKLWFLVHVFAGAAVGVGALGVAQARPEQCPALSDSVKERIGKYVEQKYRVRGPLGVTELTTVADTCYRKLRIASDSDSQNVNLLLYLSPDQRFLSRELLDAEVDPSDQERVEKEALRKELMAGGSASLGSPTAPVAITIFSDFQCPFCRREAEVLLKQVLRAEGDNVRLVFRNFPLPGHNWARAAAEAAACLQTQSNDAFWKAHDFLFEHQPELNGDRVQDAVRGIAAGAPDVDIAQYDRCVAGRLSSERIQADVDFAEGHGVRATPTLFVNEHRLEGATGAEQVRSLVRQALREEADAQQKH